MPGLSDAKPTNRPLMLRHQQRNAPGEWAPYEYMDRTDPLAASRMGMDAMRELGFGNPIGLIPGALGLGSDLYGLIDPAHQQRMTEQTRQWLLRNQAVDNAGDAQNQPGGFYGMPRR